MDGEALLKEYRERWNVPDWRERDPYLYTLGLDLHQLRWEFLRRMDYYRVAWDTGDFDSELDFGLKMLCNPAVRGDELPDDFRFFDTSIVGTILDIEPFRAEREQRKPSPTLIGLAMETDQYQWIKDKNVRKKAIIEANTPSLAEMVGERILDLINAGYVFMPFDPTYTLEDQTNSAEASLVSFKNARGKSRTNTVGDDWVSENDDIMRLRALDADNEYELLGAIAKDSGIKPARPTKKAMAHIILKERLNFDTVIKQGTENTYFNNTANEARGRARRPVFVRSPDSKNTAASKKKTG